MKAFELISPCRGSALAKGEGRVARGRLIPPKGFKLLGTVVSHRPTYTVILIIGTLHIVQLTSVNPRSNYNWRIRWKMTRKLTWKLGKTVGVQHSS